MLRAKAKLVRKIAFELNFKYSSTTCGCFKKRVAKDP